MRKPMTAKRPSGGQRTAASRVARMRERQKESGMRRVEVTVPQTRVEEIKKIAAKMRQETEMDKQITAIAKCYVEEFGQTRYVDDEWAGTSYSESYSGDLEYDEFKSQLDIAAAAQADRSTTP